MYQDYGHSFQTLLILGFYSAVLAAEGQRWSRIIPSIEISSLGTRDRVLVTEFRVSPVYQ